MSKVIIVVWLAVLVCFGLVIRSTLKAADHQGQVLGAIVNYDEQ